MILTDNEIREHDRKKSFRSRISPERGVTDILAGFNKPRQKENISQDIIPKEHLSIGQKPILTDDDIRAMEDVKPAKQPAKEKKTILTPDTTKKMYASMETSGKINADWLQLENSTFNDLRTRGLIKKDIKFEGLSNRKKEYDEVANAYIEDQKKAHGIPTTREAALWSWRPSWYKEYNGKIEDIPEDAKGVFGKTGKEVMELRKRLLEDFEKKEKEPVQKKVPVIKKGSKATDKVIKIQNKLKEEGYELEADGDFGVITEDAIKDYQKKQGIKVDGKVGKDTQDKMKLDLSFFNPFAVKKAFAETKPLILTDEDISRMDKRVERPILTDDDIRAMEREEPTEKPALKEKEIEWLSKIAVDTEQRMKVSREKYGVKPYKPSAFTAFKIPYVKGAAGFFVRPFGIEPFGSTYTKEEIERAQEEYPTAAFVGELAGGITPYVAIAPLFPASLLGTAGTFATVGGIREVGRLQTQESLLIPPKEKLISIAKETGKAAAYAPIWHYTRALKFVGRPFASALAKAGARGVGSASLTKVFGADLDNAIKQGGIITALSLMFEAPGLAKTALGRGIVKQANRIAKEAKLPEGKVIIDVEKLDTASGRTSILKLVKGLSRLMKLKGKPPLKPALVGPITKPPAKPTPSKFFEKVKVKSITTIKGKSQKILKEFPKHEYGVISPQGKVLWDTAGRGENHITIMREQGLPIAGAKFDQALRFIVDTDKKIIRITGRMKDDILKTSLEKNYETMAKELVGKGVPLDSKIIDERSREVMTLEELHTGAIPTPAIAPKGVKPSKLAPEIAKKGVAPIPEELEPLAEGVELLYDPKQAIGVKPEVAPKVGPIATTIEPSFKAKIKIDSEWRTIDNKKMTTEKALGIIKRSLGAGRYRMYGVGEDYIGIEEIKPTTAAGERVMVDKRKGIKKAVAPFKLVGKPKVPVEKPLAYKKAKLLLEKGEKLTSKQYVSLKKYIATGEIPGKATVEQIRKAHALAAEKGLLSEKHKPKPQYRMLAKAMTGKSTMDLMTREEASDFIDAIDSLIVHPGRPPKIPRTTDVITKDFAEKIPELKEIGIVEKIRPAWRVFEKIELGKEVFDPAFEAEIETTTELMNFRKEARDLRKTVGKETSGKLFLALENPGTIQLTANEAKVVKWGKKFYDDWANRLKLPKEQRRRDYITHIFEREITEALKEKHPLPADLIAALDFITPKKIFNPFIQKRLGKKVGLKKDFWAALQAYENRALKQFYYQPLIERIRVYEKYLPPNSARYLRTYITRITNRPLAIDREVNQSLKEAAGEIAKLPGGKRLAKVLTRGNAGGLLAYNFTGLLYESFLGFRPASAIKNLSQHGLALAECGPVAFAKALNILPKERKELLKLSKALQSRKAGYLPGIDETFIKGLENKRRKASMFMFRTADRKNVGDGFLAGYYEAIAKGLPKEMAIRRGDEVAKKTQYVYTKLAGAEWTQTTPGRIIGVLTTWPENWAELMNDWIRAKPSAVFKEYERTSGKKIIPTNWVKRRKSLWIYLAMVGLAQQIHKRTRFKALYYTGWTSLKALANMAHGNFAGLEVPGSVAQIVAGLATGDKRMTKTGWNRIRPDRFVVIVRELSDIMKGKKDWLGLFVYLEKKKTPKYGYKF